VRCQCFDSGAARRDLTRALRGEKLPTEPFSYLISRFAQTNLHFDKKSLFYAKSDLLKPATSCMSKAVRFVRPDQSCDECMALMTDRRMRHLPVIDQERLVGMISIGDLVKNIIAEQQFTIQQLEHYISGERA
jgi:CBS-domain-containing membrane protein